MTTILFILFVPYLFDPYKHYIRCVSALNFLAQTSNTCRTQATSDINRLLDDYLNDVIIFVFRFLIIACISPIANKILRRE